MEGIDDGDTERMSGRGQRGIWDRARESRLMRESANLNAHLRSCEKALHDEGNNACSPVDASIFRQWGVWSACFRNANKAHGSGNVVFPTPLTSGEKFAPLHWAANQMGHDHWQSMQVRDLPDLLKMIDRYPAVMKSRVRARGTGAMHGSASPSTTPSDAGKSRGALTGTGGKPA